MNERERLVELLKDNQGDSTYYMTDEAVQSVSDVLLANGVIVLPCKVGQKVYDTFEGFIEPSTVEAIFLGDYKDIDGNRSYMAELHFSREDCPYTTEEIYFTDIGKTVFFTKEEAEKALKGGEEE